MQFSINHVVMYNVLKQLNCSEKAACTLTGHLGIPVHLPIHAISRVQIKPFVVFIKIMKRGNVIPVTSTVEFLVGLITFKNVELHISRGNTMVMVHTQQQHHHHL